MAAAPKRFGSRRALLSATVAALLVLFGPAAAAALWLSHTPPLRAAECGPLAMTAVVSGDTDARSLASADVVVVGPWGERAVPMTADGSVLRVEIPGELVLVPSVTYYLRVVDATGETALYPPGAPYGLINVPVVPGGEPGARDGALGGGRLEMVSPPDAVSPAGLVDIAFIIDPPLSGSWGAFLYIDGRDVTEVADLGPGFMVLEGTAALSPGVHLVSVVAFDDGGQFEREWSIVCVDAGATASTTAEMGARRAAHGRVEIGWAHVLADTTAADSLDVYLPYEETSMPTLDFYASSYGPGRTLVMSASYDPVYHDRIRWSCSVETDRTEAEFGDVYASLSEATLDWASGLGARAAARVGAFGVEAVAMRLAEADTTVGVYARYMLAAEVEAPVAEGTRASLVFARGFDDEGSVSPATRIGDPLENEVAAGVVEFEGGRASARVEAAHSTSSGETDGDGNAVRASVSYGADVRNLVSLGYLYSDPEFYSAGSLDSRPGERGLELEFAWSPCDACWTSGSAGAYRRSDTSQQTDPDDVGFRAHGRIDGSWTLGAGSLRTYATARVEHTPYMTYDYEYVYGGAGGTWSRGPVRASLGLTRSNSRTTDSTALTGLSVDLRYTSAPRRLSGRASGNWSRSDDEGAERYRRSTYTLEMRFHVSSEADVSAEYRRIERNDATEPDQSYVEHVFGVGLGFSF